MSEWIELSKIKLDGGTQSRAGLDEATVDKYAEAMHDGDEFPAIDLIYDGQFYYLKDGFHRVAAAQRIFKERISANVEQGTAQDAQWASYSVNARHGLPRSREDTRRAVIAALKHPYAVSKSNVELANHVGVNEKTIRSYRRELELTSEIPKSDQRTGADGRTIDTTNIGTTRTSSMWKPLGDPPFEHDALVLHTKFGTVGRISVALTYELMVADINLPDTQTLQTWRRDQVRLATAEEVAAYQAKGLQANEIIHFNVGDEVLIEGSPIVGKIVNMVGDQLCITRPNPNHPNVNMTHWVNILRVRPASKDVLQVDDWVRTRSGHIGQMVMVQGTLRVRTEYGTQMHNLKTLTKIAPPEVADDQAVSDELALDEQLADQVTSDESAGWVYGDGTPLSDEDLAAREAAVDALLDQHEKRNEQAAVDRAEESMYTALHNFVFDEIKDLPPALERLLLYIHGLTPGDASISDAIQTWRDFLNRIEATLFEADKASQ